MENLTVSIIIPSHNRSSSLRRALDALHLQTYPIDLMEVIVVADSCIDDTLTMLQDYKAPFKVQAIEVNCRSAAIARNTGAASATGQLLLFLDDDIEALPPLVESHARVHSLRPGSAVMGPYPPKLQGATTLFHVQARSWWEDKFYQMSQPAHRFIYKDLLSGNLSLDAELFARLDGFDSAFGNCGGEDYEFGVRLLKADVPFVVAAGAVGCHYEHETNNLDRYFRRSRQEGRSDVLIGNRHPELRPTLQLAGYESAYSVVDKILVAIAFFWPAAVDWLALGLRKSLDLLESLRMRGTWRWLWEKLRGYWYLRGVIDELKSRSAISSFIQGGPASGDLGGHEINIDLQQGWEAAESLLDAERPTGVYLYYGQLTVGHIVPQAGAEPLRGAHLRSILALDFAQPLAGAIAVNSMPRTGETMEEQPLVAFKNYELAINKYVGDFKLKTPTSKVGKLENWEIATQNSQLKTQKFSL
ncbi:MULTISPECIES: glycosyltransferase [unclassified Microcoleus]|uniref:glycosyltransferase n=1 Tax=unclassified Microcoleus TaxID=2642155 RepID=UPI002FD15BA9